MRSRTIPTQDIRDERPADLDLGPRESRAQRRQLRQEIEARLIPDDYGRLMTQAAISLLRERLSEAKANAAKNAA